MKAELRKAAIKKRKTLNNRELSERVIKNLLATDEYKGSKNIISYYPLKYEIDTAVCIKDKTKNWYLPRVSGDFLEICPCDDLCRGSFGILEPQTKPIRDYSFIDMVIIPACAADKNGYRLGYGKGYYDRFLPLLPLTCKKVILIFSDLLYETVYPENHDVKADIIVTENRVYKFF